MSKVLVLIPCFNEKGSLLKILKKIKQKVIIMDDCSTDGLSKEIKKLKNKNFTIISNKKNYGYEKNLLIGFQKVIKTSYDYVITFDADGEHDTKDLLRMEKYLALNKVDLLIGVRKSKNRYIEKLLSFFFKIFLNIDDPLSGFKAYKINRLKETIAQIRTNFFLVDILTLFKRKKLLIKSIPVNSKILDNRRSRVGNEIFVNLKILRCLKLIL